MTRRNKPGYRRNRTALIMALGLCDQHEAGVPLSGEELVTAKAMKKLLTEKELDYLRLYYQSGMTHQQIARHLQCAPSTVSKGISRGERRIRDLIE